MYWLICIFFKNSVNIVNGKTAVNVVIHSNNRGKSAGADASASLQRELAVGRTFSVTDTQFFLKLVENIS